MLFACKEGKKNRTKDNMICMYVCMYVYKSSWTVLCDPTTTVCTIICCAYFCVANCGTTTGVFFFVLPNLKRKSWMTKQVVSLASS